jgi:uncharacterized protein YhdP
MKKILKILVILIAVVIALVILATLGLRIAFPPAKLSRIIETQLREHTQREARLDDVRLGVSGLTLKSFKWSNVPAFSAGTFLSVERMTVRWALWPLLSRKLQVNEIFLEKPQIEIIRMADGKTYNISDLAGAAAASGKTSDSKIGQSGQSSQPSPSKNTWGWRVNAIQLKNGTIQFTDRSPARQTSTLADIDLLLRDFDPTRVEGQLTIARLQNPVYNARDFSMEWLLRDINANLGQLNGWLRLKQGPGKVQNLDRLARSSPAAKLALMPLLTLQSLDQLGLVRLGLPNFSRLEIDQITGDYGFKDGVMTINQFKVEGPELTIVALGTIQLATEKLAIDVMLNTTQPVLMGETSIKVQVGGTISHPKTNLDSLKQKAFKATIKNILNNPDTLKNLKDVFK